MMKKLMLGLAVGAMALAAGGMASAEAGPRSGVQVGIYLGDPYYYPPPVYYPRYYPPTPAYGYWYAPPPPAYWVGRPNYRPHHVRPYNMRPGHHVGHRPGNHRDGRR